MFWEDSIFVPRLYFRFPQNLYELCKASEKSNPGKNKGHISISISRTVFPKNSVLNANKIEALCASHVEAYFNIFLYLALQM